MGTARERHVDRRQRQHQFHLSRVHTAPGLVEKLEAAFGLVRANLVNTNDPAAAHRLATELLSTLLGTAERIPRSGA